LIDYLENIKITPINAKEILDLNVSNVLQAGTIDARVRNLLNVLKSALLVRYFPDDLKNNKNFLKMAKKKSQAEAKLDKSMDMSENYD
jgi:hypothetical protein